LDSRVSQDLQELMACLGYQEKMEIEDIKETEVNAITTIKQVNMFLALLRYICAAVNEFS
jgi:hypothetical protein